MRYVLTFIFFTVFAVGCCSEEFVVPSYVFRATLPRAEEWTAFTPPTRHQDERKFVLTNAVTGARIDFYSSHAFYRAPSSYAGELKVRFAKEGCGVGDIVDSESKGEAVSFRIRYPNGDKGEAVVFRLVSVRESIIAIGHWPSAHDAQAVADMGEIIARIEVWPEVRAQRAFLFATGKCGYFFRGVLRCLHG
jgi:hypothetical protein